MKFLTFALSVLALFTVGCSSNQTRQQQNQSTNGTSEAENDSAKNTQSAKASKDFDTGPIYRKDRS